MIITFLRDSEWKVKVLHWHFKYICISPVSTFNDIQFFHYWKKKKKLSVSIALELRCCHRRVSFVDTSLAEAVGIRGKASTCYSIQVSFRVFLVKHLAFCDWDKGVVSHLLKLGRDCLHAQTKVWSLKDHITVHKCIHWVFETPFNKWNGHGTN